MSRLYQRGRVYYSDVNIPGHPKADKTGRVRIPLGTDQRAALQKLTDLLSLSDAAHHGHAPVDISWPDFKEKFLKWARGGKAAPTLKHDQAAIGMLEEHVMPRRLAEITPERLEMLQSAIRAAGHIPSLNNRRIQSIKAMMRKAEAWGYIKAQKWDSVRQLKEPRGRLLFYTPEQLSNLIKGTSGIWRTIALMASRAGLRRSEVFWMDWESVDFGRNRVHVAPRYDEKGNLLWSPKDHERRWVPMAADLRGYMEKLPQEGRWVIPHGPNTRSQLEMISSYFKKLSKKAGLKGGIHTLRHAFASHLASSGKVTLHQIKELLGHASIEQTEIYAHLMPDVVETAVVHLPKLDGTIVP
jgi:integrase